jgi:hypothetical protein
VSCRVTFAWIAAAALVACSAPTQYGGPILVDAEGLSERLTHLCRIGSNGAPAGACAAPVASQQSAPQVPLEPPHDDPYLAIDEQADDAQLPPGKNVLAAGHGE